MGIVASGGLTVTDVNDGITARLTNDTFVAGAENDGTSPNLTGAATTMSIFIGTTDDSANWTVAATPSSGVTGSLAGKTYTVSGFTLDAGYVDLTASRSGYSSVTARFTLSKSKKGKRGSVTTARAISGSVWSDGEAASAITAAISGTPEASDTVTLYNSSTGYTETKIRTSGGTWSTLTAFFGGDVIVDGTLRASKLAVGDRSNMVHDPLFEEIASWVNGGGATFTVSTGNMGTWGQDRVLSIAGPSANYSSARARAFLVEEGDVILYSSKAQLVTGTPVTFSAYMTLSTSADGVTFTQVSTAGLTVSDLAGGTPSQISGRYVIPSGVRYARLTLLKTGAGSVTEVKFSMPRVRFKTLAGLLDYPSMSVEGLAVFGDSIQSDDYVANSTGWKIHKNGTIEAENLRLTSKNMTIDLDTMPQAWAKQSCVVVSVANIVRYGLITIDGVTLVAGDRVLLVGQTAAGENGIYVASASSWTRSIDADTATKIAGGVVSINKGTTYSGTHWITDIKSNATIGTTAMNWGQMLHDESIIPNTMISGLGDLSTLSTIDLTYLPSAWVKQDCLVALDYDIDLSIGTTSVDGVSLSGGERVLVMGQTLPAQNGIYIASAGAGTWTRAADCNAGSELAGAVVSVTDGATYGATQWACKFETGQTIGVADALWEKVITSGDVNSLALATAPDLTYFPKSGFKEICRLCSDTNITVAYTGAISIDGLSVTSGDRILLIGQTDPKENGIWIGEPAAAWTRAPDADANADLYGATVAVFRGSTYGGKQFVTNWKFGDALGTDPMNWYQTLNTNSSLASSKLSGLLGSTVIPAFTGGDVTSPGGSLVLSIGANKVTLGMMAQVATATLLGRTTAGTGNIEALTAAQGRTVLGLGALATLGSVSLTTQATGVLQAAQAPAHSGDVTSSAGSLALTIAANAVSLSKMAQLATSTILGRATAGTGNVEGLTAAQVKTILGITSGDVGGLGALATASSVSLTTQATGTLQAAQAPAFTGGDVTSSAGSLALTIAANAVTNAKAAQMATKTIKGNDGGSTANASDLTIAQVMAMLGLFNPMLIPASAHDVACCIDGVAASATLAGAADRCDIYQFFAGNSFTASGMKCSISTGVAATNVKLVLYATGQNGRPTTLLGETADISSAANAIVGGAFTDANVNIVQGQMYFVGIRCSGTASYNTWAAGSVPRLNAGVANTGQRCIFRRTITYASGAPSSWNYAAGEINTGNAPALWLTVA